MSGTFFDRQRELALLQEIDRRKGAQLVAIYGRRRIGKTALLVRWLAMRPKSRAVYWVAERSTHAALLAKFSAALGQIRGSPDLGLSFSSWEAALQEVARLAERHSLILVIDELPYLLESVPSFATVLQASWDHVLRKSKVRLIVSGSHFHMMQDTLASARGPLFGRTTADLVLGELGLEDMSLFLPNYSKEQLLETYSVIGGVPTYLEVWSDRRPVLANIRDAILSPVSIFRNEPSFLIQDEIADPRTYLAILEAIGTGMKRPVDIARKAGVNLAHVGKYLYTLELLGFLRRIVSVDAPSPRIARTSQYEIRDPYLRFHFTFVQPNLRLVEQERIDRLMSIIGDGLDSYVGHTGYEEICRRHVAALSDRGELSFDAADVGRMWDRRVEIDIVAVDRKTRNALIAECRWRRSRVGVDVLDDLRDRAARLSKLDAFKVHYALFSRAGFTSALEKRARAEDVLLIEGIPSLRPPKKSRSMRK